MNMRFSIKSTAICCQDPELLSDFGLKGHEVEKNHLPAALRRRTSLTTRMAVTAAFHACEQAGVDPGTTPSVFASVGGEIQVTDSLCRNLTDFDALLSPTQFHNSVHNTTSGYWSILNQCRATTTAIAAEQDTFAMGLLEACSQLLQYQGDILLVCYDENWPQYLAPPIGKIPFVCALTVSNDSCEQSMGTISMPKIETGKLIQDRKALELVQSAPAAASIPLLQAITNLEPDCHVPLNFKGATWFTHYKKT